MSFLKKLFGLGSASGGEAAGAASGPTVEHQGFTIRASPYQEGGQFQTAGVIEKEIAGVKREHKFIRAERHNTHQEAVEFSFAKGRQIVDERGEKLFD
jgi:hypothetical protein